MIIDRILQALKRFPERVRQQFERKPDRFINRIQQQCELGIEATQALRDYLGKLNKNAQRVRQLEKNGDEIHASWWTNQPHVRHADRSRGHSRLHDR